jgi:hypothetical protein
MSGCCAILFRCVSASQSMRSQDHAEPAAPHPASESGRELNRPPVAGRADARGRQLAACAASFGSGIGWLSGTGHDSRAERGQAVSH